MAKKTSTATKIAIGAGVLALAGGLFGYYLWKKGKAVTASSTTQGGDAGVSQFTPTKFLTPSGVFKKKNAGCPVTTSCEGLYGTGKPHCDSAGNILGYC